MMLKDLFDSFLNLIYKRKCIVCGCSKEDNYLCKTCAKNVEYLSCFAHKIYKGCTIYSATIYDETIKKLIQKLKFSYKKQASIPLAKILFNYFKNLCLDNRNFIIVYPNIFVLKKFKRGYNQVELIVKEFSKLSNIKFLKNTILKIKYTKPQYKATNRKNNIKGSFKINPKKLDLLKNKTVLLIDDILTSGATVEEIIDCFNKENITNIICLTVAKAKH